MKTDSEPLVELGILEHRLGPLLALRRILASALDGLLLLLVLLSAAVLPNPLPETFKPLLPLSFLSLLILLWLYAEVKTGQSLGKALMRLEIVYPTGRHGRAVWRVMLRNLVKYLVLVLTGWLALEFFPFAAQASTAQLWIWPLWYGFWALLMNVWVLSPRMQQYPPGKCIHEWVSGTGLRATPMPELYQRVAVGLFACLLLATGIFFCVTLLLQNSIR